MSLFKTWRGWVAVLAAGVSLNLASPSAFSAERSFRLYTVEVNGTKFWIPSTIVVKKGDSVKIEAMTKLEGAASVHGLSIPDFKIQEVVDQKARILTFVADKSGIFPISCHLHPPHVGSQLVVLE
ncbi:MAG: Cupredoxin-like domain [Pseudomonadota bacterium]|jgi:plastocyanin